MEIVKELTISREFDAPRERVYKAWSDTNLLGQWWGPDGVTNPTVEWDFRPGGKIYHVMLAGPEMGELAGQEWPMRGEFNEVVEPEKLVFTSSPLADGKPLLDTVTTVTFDEKDGKTLMTVHIAVGNVTPEGEFAVAGMEAGWNQQADHLVALVAK